MLCQRAAAYEFNQGLPLTSEDVMMMFHDEDFTVYSEDLVLMESLIKKIIKYRYAAEVYGMYILTPNEVSRCYRVLTELETKYSNLKRDYSPLSGSGFDILKARKAFGGDKWKSVETMIRMVSVVSKIKNLDLEDRQ